MSDGPESSPLKKIPVSAHGPLTLPTGEEGISLYKAYTLLCRRNNPLFHGCYKRQLIVKGPCADPGIFFMGGGSGPSGISTILFQGSRGGPTFSVGGPTSSRGGGIVSDCLLPIETHITCDFPVSPSGSAHEDTTIRGLK